MSNKRFHSLSIKTTLVSTFGLILCICIYVISQLTFGGIITNIYLSDSKCNERQNSFLRDFSRFVTINGIESTDKEQIRDWCRDKKYVFLSIYDGKTLLYETDGTLTNTDADDPVTLYSDNNTVVAESFPKVEFPDGTYSVNLIEFTEQKYYSIIGWVGLFTAMFCYIVIIASYNRHTVHRVVELSQIIKNVSDNKDNRHISCSGNDEITDLGESAEKMRNSIIKNYESEQAAWEANKDLLTSISHDIRTPLTSLLVYSEALKNGDVNDTQMIKKYSSVCYSKAVQLKDLTDSMFRYFLVYGQKNADCKIESFKASDIIPQLIYEPTFYLQQQNFIINTPSLEQDCNILTDPSLLKRVVDNVFSNVRKYAKKDKPVSICISTGDMLKISVINYIDDENRKAESTKIGLKSCEKAMELTRGRFYYSEQKGIFEVEISILIK